MLQPHHHDWQSLDGSPFDWCPECGEVREHQQTDSPEEDDMGGKPSKGTPADKRLGTNKPRPKGK